MAVGTHLSKRAEDSLGAQSCVDGCPRPSERRLSWRRGRVDHDVGVSHRCDDVLTADMDERQAEIELSAGPRTFAEPCADIGERELFGIVSADEHRYERRR